MKISFSNFVIEQRVQSCNIQEFNKALKNAINAYARFWNGDKKQAVRHFMFVINGE